MAFVQYLHCAVHAGATAGSHAKLLLQRPEISDTGFSDIADLLFSYRIADTNVHVAGRFGFESILDRK
jgi:hypothetical protein